MSSSNRIRITSIAESTYGVTPGVGNFNTTRYTSESLSGTPETTESQEIRSDRLSSGQTVVGLTVGGDLNGELSKDAAFEAFLESAMYSTWITSVAVNADLDVDVVNKELTRVAGNWNSDVFVGAVLTLTGFANSVNNTQVMVMEIVSNTVIKFAGPDTMVDENDTGNTFKVADYLAIGTTTKSFSMEKAFQDLTNKAINYTGMIVGSLSLNIAYGSIATYSLSFSGNGHEPVDAAADFMTDGRTINAASTTNTLNGSVDMPFFCNSAGGNFEDSPFCIQSITINLNNNLRPQTCIGQAAPDFHNAGKAGVEASMTAYLEDSDWALLDSKITQEPFKVGGIVKNSSGGYGFYIPALQVSFDDPASAGENQDVFLNMSGVGKVGSNSEKSLYIFRF